VRKVSTQQAAEMTIIENLQRDDLSPLEHAEAFRILSLEFKLSQAQIGQRVGLSRESVANYMRLLKLPEAAIELLRNGSLSFGKAKELLRLDDDVAVAAAATYAVKHGMTIEEIQRLVTNFEIGGDYGHPVQPKSGGARWVDPNVRAAQNELQQILGVKVKISDRKGKGKIVIEYATVEDYERVVGMLRGE
jgi:ParB family transcriptional regulator, chromosome partitioning protein